nr:3-keto-5-aminohexanoate cleavage protein [Maliibacterium massiliense]
MRKIVLSVAPICAASTRVIPQEVAAEVDACHSAGASMVHLHVRNRQGALTPALEDFAETIADIRSRGDIVIQASTGGVSQMSIQQRCAPLALDAVETVSLNVGSVNLGEAVYQNPAADVRWCVDAIRSARKFPEVEVFELGMIESICQLHRARPIAGKLLLNIVLGHAGAAPGTVQALCAMQGFLPQEAIWGVTHAGRQGFDVLACAVAMGACLVRIGFEDSPYLDAGVKADGNAQIVARMAQIIRAMGHEVATPAEARAIFGIA